MIWMDRGKIKCVGPQHAVQLKLWMNTTFKALTLQKNLDPAASTVWPCVSLVLSDFSFLSFSPKFWTNWCRRGSHRSLLKACHYQQFCHAFIEQQQISGYYRTAVEFLLATGDEKGSHWTLLAWSHSFGITRGVWIMFKLCVFVKK